MKATSKISLYSSGGNWNDGQTIKDLAVLPFQMNPYLLTFWTQDDECIDCWPKKLFEPPTAHHKTWLIFGYSVRSNLEHWLFKGFEMYKEYDIRKHILPEWMMIM